jgi:hypothetical protein
VTPPPLPCFLEVLILGDLEREISEVLILIGLKSFRMNTIRGVLEVLIIKGLKFDFSEVLILEELRREKCEIKGVLRGVSGREISANALRCGLLKRGEFGRDEKGVSGPTRRARVAAEIICGADVRLQFTPTYSMSGNCLSRLFMSYSNRMGRKVTVYSGGGRGTSESRGLDTIGFEMRKGRRAGVYMYRCDL